MDFDPNKLYHIDALYLKRSENDSKKLDISAKSVVLYREEPLPQANFELLLRKVVRDIGNDLSQVVQALTAEHGFEVVPVKSIGIIVNQTDRSPEAEVDKRKLN